MSDTDQGLSRREPLRTLAVAPVVAAFACAPGEVDRAAHRVRQRAAGAAGTDPYTPTFFTPHEEYSLSWNSLDTGLNLFFSREVRGRAGEDLVEKQNAETGLMPVVAGEAVAYGYTAEARHFVRAFLGKEPSRLTFDDGLDVVRLLMTAYQSAEQRTTPAFPPPEIDRFVPAVAKGSWNPRLPAADEAGSQSPRGVP